jgi:hypothetical protein
VSAAAVPPPTPPMLPKKVERRWSKLPWGIEIQTWQLVQTRTLPVESASLPLATLFADDQDTELGAVPSEPNDQADTLESGPEADGTRENPAPSYDAYKTEKP